jgi:NADPH-dependent 2,4-dienoyl-CoA reductase/sulfur reductase-like enzyme
MTLSFDVVVVGAGPGGIAAAVTAAEAGSRVCLIDDNSAPGGQIWRRMADESTQPPLYRYWIARLRATDCQVWSGMSVISTPAPNLLRLEGRTKVDSLAGAEVHDLAFRRLILATGARERFLPFPGWTLPGVMGVGAAQAFLKSGYSAAGKSVIVAGSGPLLLAVAAGLCGQGAVVDGIYEQASFFHLAKFGLTLVGQPEKLLEGATYRHQAWSAPYRTGCWVLKAEGDKCLERVTISNGRRLWTVPCQLLACGFHLVPNLELPRLLGCQIEDGFVRVDTLQQSSLAQVACVGELTGIGGLDKALIEGQIAGWNAAGSPQMAAHLKGQLAKQQRFAERLSLAFQLRPELRALASAETLLCRCEDVRFHDVSQTANAREAKLHTRFGMGACQGRVCGSAAEFLFGWEQESPRPPLVPCSVATLATPSEEA